MINDLIHSIRQDSIRLELMKEEFDTVICYPGAGADIYPCAIIEKVDNEKLKIPNYKDKSVLYLFCDPSFTTDESVQNNYLYSKYITNLCGKKNIRIEQLLEICEESGLYKDGYSSYKNVEEMMSFSRINYDIEESVEGYYCKLVIASKVCHILMLTCEAKRLWKLLEQFKISVEGAFLWDVQNWGIAESIENVQKEYLPKWIIGNRYRKFGGYGHLYKGNKYEEEVAKLIFEVRGADYDPEQISIGYLL
ncbi:hypothetical protein [Butyrivibrio sp. XPD2006]|uniref:hypothetical protein n=1 Tax=Butyrivibrio sp. XPD2006 TaxID=1280668 RepID=UPI0003B6FFBB|nr:hypothetical protein [Butyrivibrio sp. XPD2006]